MSPRLSNWLKQGALLAASFLFGLLLIEAMLRLFGWSHPLFAQPDRDLGWSFRPGVSGWSSHENTAFLRMNRFGFRGADWTREPGEGTLRIAMLGDSFLDSSNLADEHDLARVVESALNTSCPALAPRKAEVLNFGVSGYGTAQQYLLLEQRVAEFRPAVAVLAFYAGNDVANNSRSLSPDGQKTKPYFTMAPSGELQLDMSFRDSNTFRKALQSDWQRRLVNASYLLQALKQVARGRPVIPEPLVYDNSSADKPQTLFGAENEALFSPPSGEAWQSAWAVTEKLLLRMRDRTTQQRIDFGVAIVPDPVQAVPGEAWRDALARRIKAEDIDYPVRRIADFATQNNIKNLDLLAPLRAYGDREQVFLYGFPPKLGNGHLNETGSRVAGKEIADWLCRDFVRQAQSSAKAPL
ncbi:hypothetical protein [Pseudorhodoplanes sp.]|uniref:hypothetical protein n=1 Tax=Pseudorhodoplanes sp. TaxID=1934341 RepID=UPI00391A0AFB